MLIGGEEETNEPLPCSQVVSPVRSHTLEAPEIRHSVYDFVATPPLHSRVSMRTRKVNKSKNVSTNHYIKGKNTSKVTRQSGSRSKRSNVRLSKKIVVIEDDSDDESTGSESDEDPWLSTALQAQAEKAKNTRRLHRKIQKDYREGNNENTDGDSDNVETSLRRTRTQSVKQPNIKIGADADIGERSDDTEASGPSDRAHAATKTNNTRNKTKRNSQLWVSPGVPSGGTGNSSKKSLRQTPKSHSSLPGISDRTHTPVNKGRRSHPGASVKTHTPVNRGTRSHQGVKSSPASTRCLNWSVHQSPRHTPGTPRSGQNGSFVGSPSVGGSPAIAKRNAKGETALHLAAIKVSTSDKLSFLILPE